jgi:hypothetical protein
MRWFRAPVAVRMGILTLVATTGAGVFMAVTALKSVSLVTTGNLTSSRLLAY